MGPDSSDRKPGADKDEEAFAKQNSKDRRLSFQFLRENSLGKLLLVRILMEPLRKYLAKQFERAGESWAMSQKARATQDDAKVQKLRIVETAEGVDDAFFLRQTRLLF